MFCVLEGETRDLWNFSSESKSPAFHSHVEMKSHNQQLFSKTHNGVPAPPPITRGNATSTSNGLLFLSKNQVPQQQDALLSALGYHTKEEKETKTSVWGVSLKSHPDNTVKDSLKTQTGSSSSLSPLKAEQKQTDITSNTISTVNRNGIRNESETDISSLTHPASNNFSHRRNVSPSTTGPVEDDQVEYMRQLAKERSEKRRLEEEARILEQQERAAARLLELEQNMGVSSPKVVDASKDAVVSSSEFSRDNQSPEKRLFDPYSDRKTSDNRKGEASFSRTSISSIPSNTSFVQQQVENKMLLMDRVVNYNDRSSGTSSGPRMLFDPKSGSMIAAPSSNSNTSKVLKETKKKKKSTTPNHADVAGTARERNHSKDVSGENSNTNTSTTDFNNETSSLRKGTSASATDKNQVNHKIKKKRLPRTCGVLYARDENGSFVSVDGCDGDKGYGYHLFPGGRISNSKAYEAYEKQGRQVAASSNNSSTVKISHETFKSSSAQLNRSHFMRKTQTRQDSVNASDDMHGSTLLKGDEKLDLLTGLDESPKLQATAAVWAPSEAVLALTTAKTSSKQVISYSKDDFIHHGDMSDSGMHVMSDISVIDNEKDHQNLGESPSVGLGLGFDPTKNMDSVIMSPSLNGSMENSLNLSQLDISNTQSSKPMVPSNASSLLGSSPWAARESNHPSMGSLSDWDFSSHTSKEVDKHASASFLSFGGLGGARNTWGSS